MSPKTDTKTRTTASALARRTATLPGGMPTLKFGTGSPLIVLPGLSPTHAPPVGMARQFETAPLMPFARQHRVWWIGRREGLAQNASMADIARDYADALRSEFPGPVDILGISTGGSVALQLAVDHPDVVQRLVIASSAYTLGPTGKLVQRRIATELQAGRPRQAASALMRPLGTTPVARRLLSAIGWVLGPLFYRRTTPDMIATIEAEDRFNLRDRLGDIAAPTLVVGGDCDGFYSEELFRETAARIPHGRLVLYAGKGHMGALADRRFAQDVLEFLDGRGASGASAPEPR